MGKDSEYEEDDGFNEVYTHEEIKRPDETFERLMKNAKGVVVRKAFHNTNGHVTEILDYDDDGTFEERTIYIYKEDWHMAAWKIITYDTKGKVTRSQERDTGPH